MSNQAITLLNHDITTAESIVAVSYGDIDHWVGDIVLEAIFTYGSSGTSAKAYIQTSLDGTNWTDIACFAFTTSSARKIANLSSKTPVTTIYTPTDGSLTDNTVKDGIIGAKLQVKYVTTGTYAGVTNLKVIAHLKP